MFRQVYFHRTLRSAEAVLVSTLKRALELMRSDKLSFRMRGSVFEKMVMREEVAVSEYLQLDDIDISFHLKQWTKEPDPVLSDLARRFIDRRLFKAIDVDLPADGAERFWRCARQVVEQAGFDPEYYLIMDRAIDIPYYGYYSPVDVDSKGLIYIDTGGPQPAIREISEISAAVRGMHGYRIDRACFPAEVTDEMARLIGECAGEAQSNRAV
jgi:HD superfamily phosphohydrolase